MTSSTNASLIAILDKILVLILDHHPVVMETHQLLYELHHSKINKRSCGVLQ